VPAPDAISNAARGLLALTLVPGMGPVRIARLLEALGTFERIRAASAAELARVPGMGDKTARALLEGLKAADAPVDRELEQLAKAGAHLITLADEDYPPLLRSHPRRTARSLRPRHAPSPRPGPLPRRHRRVPRLHPLRHRTEHPLRRPPWDARG
jgi:predicted Rossmann fold nucleotide-binding protein DprA/Smf involved in DNA uptake